MIAATRAPYTGDPDELPDLCPACGNSGEFEDEEGWYTDCPLCVDEWDAARAAMMSRIPLWPPCPPPNACWPSWRSTRARPSALSPNG
mgnify:CR=1 FL=1